MSPIAVHPRRATRIGWATAKTFSCATGLVWLNWIFFSQTARRPKPAAAGGVSIALANGKFHSYEETLAEFKSLATAHPDLARYSRLGSSFEGREIFVLKI